MLKQLAGVQKRAVHAGFSIKANKSALCVQDRRNLKGYYSCNRKSELHFLHVWPGSDLSLASMFAEGSEVFRVKKSNHSKKIVKQLKREYKEDLEKSGSVKQDSKSGVSAVHRTLNAASLLENMDCVDMGSLKRALHVSRRLQKHHHSQV